MSDNGSAMEIRLETAKNIATRVKDIITSEVETKERKRKVKDEQGNVTETKENVEVFVSRAMNPGEIAFFAGKLATDPWLLAYKQGGSLLTEDSQEVLELKARKAELVKELATITDRLKEIQPGAVFEEALQSIMDGIFKGLSGNRLPSGLLRDAKKLLGEEVDGEGDGDENGEDVPHEEEQPAEV